MPLTSEELAADFCGRFPLDSRLRKPSITYSVRTPRRSTLSSAARLLEAVFDQYFRFMAEQKIVVTQPERRLPIIVFASTAEFQTFAAKQHPEISFADTPGYYSVRDNQTLLLDLTGDRSIRIGWRAFANVLQRSRCRSQPSCMRRCINWHSIPGCRCEWLIIHFGFPKGWRCTLKRRHRDRRLLWNRPGLVNPRHHPAFMKLLEGQSDFRQA